MVDFNPVGIKYLGGWGDGSDVTSAVIAGSAASISEILKKLRKYSKSDREYIRDKWRALYLFYAEALVQEDDQTMIVNDNYLKSLNRSLGL